MAERNYKEWSKTSSALGIANRVLWTVREMLTSSESMKKYADVPTVLQAMTLSGAGAVEFARYYYASVLAEQDDDWDLANYIQAAASLNVIDAVCTMVEADALQAEAYAQSQGLEHESTPIQKTAKVLSYEVGCGWIGNAAAYFERRESTAWEGTYWGTKWACESVPPILEFCSGNQSKLVEESKIVMSGISIGLHILYPDRAIGVWLPSILAALSPSN